MRKFLFFLFSLSPLIFIGQLNAQTPQCSVAGTFTNRAGDQTDGTNNIAVAAGIASSVDYNNINAHCTGWVFSYTSDGFSAVSVHFESAAGSNTAHGTYGDFAGTIASGTNPATATTSSVIVATGYYPWMRVRLASSTGTGLIIWHMDGYVNLNQVSQRGGGSGGGGKVQVAGSIINSTARTYINFVTGEVCTDSAGNDRVNCDPDPATVASPQSIHNNLNFCDSATGTTAMTCGLSGAALAAYAAGQLMLMRADTANPVSVAIDGLTTPCNPCSLKAADGTSAPPSITAKKPFFGFYDETNHVFRVLSF